jgi:hypothetical protein
MALVELGRLKAALNSDPEFRIQARFWDARIRIVFGEEPVTMIVRTGVVERLEAPSGENFMTDSRDYDIEIKAPVDEWRKFLQKVPKPFYQDLFSAVTRHNFTYGGNMKMFFAYYGALRRAFHLMRSFTTAAAEA